MTIAIDIMDYELHEEDVLDQISIEALEEELYSRRVKTRYNMPRDCAQAVIILRENGCPEEIIRTVDEWIHAPMATPAKLQSWLALCEQEGR